MTAGPHLGTAGTSAGTTSATAVLVTGAAGRLGRRLVPRLLADDQVARVVLIDTEPAPTLDDPRVEAHQANLVDVDLEPLVAGVDVVVHLAFSDRTELDDEGARAVNVGSLARLLRAFGAAGGRHAIVVSSAMVYGAWPNNPVPLTEEALLRPNPDLVYARHKVDVERVCADWVAGDPANRKVAVARPTVAIAQDDPSWLARALAGAAGIRLGDADPPVQFLHLDDLAEALEVLRRAGYDGPCNVAPDGWLTGEEVRRLAGSARKVPLPARLAASLARWSWELRQGPIPPGLLAYTSASWVVANDRLEELGWRPRWTNEEAYVAATDGSWWSTVSPKRRQELALGAAGAAVVGATVGVSALARRLWRRRR